MRYFLWWRLSAPGGLDKIKWNDFRDEMGAWLLGCVIIFTALTLWLYRKSSKARQIRTAGDLFSHYSPINWQWLALIVPCLLVFGLYYTEYEATTWDSKNTQRTTLSARPNVGMSQSSTTDPNRSSTSDSQPPNITSKPSPLSEALLAGLWAGFLTWFLVRLGMTNALLTPVNYRYHPMPTCYWWFKDKARKNSGASFTNTQTISAPASKEGK